MRAIVSLSLTLVLLSACYRLDTSSGKFRCDAPGDVCPTGTSCVAGLCRERSDENIPPAEADLRPADLAPAGSGCAAAGVRLAGQGDALVFACEGGFAQGAASTLCRAGYHVCGAADEALLVRASQDGRCTSTPGFYASQVEAALAESVTECRPTSTTPRRVLLGCGVAGAGVRVHPIALEKGCSGLQVALPCEAETPGWTCTKGLADATHSQDERGGVLCCANR